LAVALPGDYNNNGIVDGADCVVWRKSLGQTGTGLAADGNGNGVIDNGDYNVWRLHFGQTAGSGAALPSAESLSAAVPEASTLVLMILAAVGWGVCRQRSA
jgi:hypothetical protein